MRLPCAFAMAILEDLIKQIADAMINSGVKDAGYQYVVIDDCWQMDRDANDNIVPDPQHFPSGIYSDAGTGTCQNRPGGRGYESQDSRQYAAWGVDYLKYDWCIHTTQNSEASYPIMRDALKKSGRPIVFSLSEWGPTKPWLCAVHRANIVARPQGRGQKAPQAEMRPICQAHAAVADFQHVRIVPIARTGVALEAVDQIQDLHHVQTTPLLGAGPLGRERPGRAGTPPACASKEISGNRGGNRVKQNRL
jgi:Alpha galactosidase A